jgi:hypothetical protein
LLWAAFVVALRHDIRIVPVAATVIATAATLRDGWSRSYPGALAGAIVATVMMAIAAYAWFRALTAVPEETFTACAGVASDPSNQPGSAT